MDSGANKGAVTDSEIKNPVGIVVSDVRDKTITVEVRRVIKHQRYGKYLTRSTRYHAHDEKNEAQRGDRVEIEFTRPISKQKRYRLVKIVERGADMSMLDVREIEEAALRSSAKEKQKPPAPKPAAAPETAQ